MAIVEPRLAVWEDVPNSSELAAPGAPVKLSVPPENATATLATRFDKLVVPSFRNAKVAPSLIATLLVFVSAPLLMSVSVPPGIDPRPIERFGPIVVVPVYVAVLVTVRLPGPSLLSPDPIVLVTNPLMVRSTPAAVLI